MLRIGGGPDSLRKVKYAIVRWTRGKGLDIGRGPWKAFPHFIGVRERSDKDMPPNIAADFAVDSFDDLSDVVSGDPLDFIFVWCDAAIEDQAIKLLKVGGYYIAANGDSVFVRRKTDSSTFEVVDQRPCQWGTKTVCVTRYGALGDMLQVASILPELKRQGYHITMNCHPDGEDTLRNDKNIDSFWVQDRDQVPNGELTEYWAWMEKQFDRHVNLCECVEGTLLTYPGRANHRWPFEVRKKYCDLNYLEFMAELAGLPFHPEHHFYPTEGEEKWARRFVLRVKELQGGDPFFVMWALSGSSVHKFYPHQDSVIARMLLEIPNVHIIFVGDEACQILEQGWQNESRISCLSGRCSVRNSLTLAQMCALVIGPETGTLNAVAFDTMSKIVLLSHSSANNLTRDWANTEALHSTVTPCYPCHRMHLNHDFCPQDKESGAAMCQVELSPNVVWEAVHRAYSGWSAVKSLMNPGA
jgi:ADP-heptose:LPS heptosyltransferase